MNVLDYFLKANLYGLMFASCYWFFLRRHTFFGLNRAYLLLAGGLTLLLPLVSLPTQTVDQLDGSVPVGVIALPVATIQATPTNITVETTEPIQAATDWAEISLVLYTIIAGFLLIRLTVRIAKLIQLIDQSDRRAQQDYWLVVPADATIPTFSFFRSIVLNPTDAHNERVLQHELVHVRQYHSVDVLALSVLRGLFWACPALGLIDKMLRQVHEFLADQAVIVQVVDQPAAYARFLVEYAFGVQVGQPQADVLTNGFFSPSLIKQRIQMLHRRATTRWALGKYALVLPLGFGLLAMTTAREQIQSVVSQATDEPITITGKVTSGVNGKPLSGAIVLITSTGKGMPTDAKGNFTLRNVSQTATLSISSVGFATRLLPVAGHTAWAISLEPAKPDELPVMGATAMYKAIKPVPGMPVRTPPSSETMHGKTYTAVEESAVFPTGVPGLMAYVAHNLHYPAKAKAARIEGTVYVQFVVMPNGSVGAVTIKKGLDAACDEEAVRVVKKMPAWIPGQQNGKPIAQSFIIPIQFSLETKADKRTGQLHSAQPDQGQLRVSTGTNGNSRFAVFDDFRKKIFAPADSNPATRSDSTPRLPLKFRPSSVQQPSQRSTLRYQYLMPPNVSFRITTPSRGLPGEQAELFLLNGTRQIDRVEDINPADIESIEVSKDEKTIARYKVLYGEKAAKGVVVIHLKSANAL